MALSNIVKSIVERQGLFSLSPPLLPRLRLANEWQIVPPVGDSPCPPPSFHSYTQGSTAEQRACPLHWIVFMLRILLTSKWYRHVGASFEHPTKTHASDIRSPPTTNASKHHQGHLTGAVPKMSLYDVQAKNPVNIRRNSAGLPNPIGGCSRLPGVALELSFTHNLKQTSLQPPGVFDIAMGITIMTPWWSQLRYGNVRQEFKTRYNKVQQDTPMTISQIFGGFCQEWLESVLPVSCPLELSDSKNPKTLRATNPAPTHRPRMKFGDEVKWSEAIKQKLDERGWKRYTVEHPQNRARKIVWMNSIESYCNIISSFYVRYRIYIIISITCCIIPWDPEGGWTKAVSKGNS